MRPSKNILLIKIMRWFETQEFSDFERCCNGILGWPHWHHAVMLLYGGHVALNHVICIVLLHIDRITKN